MELVEEEYNEMVKDELPLLPSAPTEEPTTIETTKKNTKEREKKTAVALEV